KAALASAYREKFDPTVRTKFDALERNPSTRPEEFYLLAHRYRFSAVGASAYALAADRLLELGDLSAAHALYQLAVRGGWTPDETRAAQIELLRRLGEGKAIALFPSPTTQPEPPSSIPAARIVKPTASYTRPI